MGRLGDRLALLLILAVLAIIILICATPLFFMGGIAGLIYGTMSIGASLGFGIPGLIVMVFAFWWIMSEDLEKRQKGEKSGKNNILITIAVVGIIEIIFGLIQSIGSSDLETFHRFMLVGGGIISFLPAFIFSIIVIYLQKSGKLMQQPSKSNLRKPKKKPYLQDKSDKSKMRVLWELGKLEDKQAIPLVLDALKDKDVYVRRRAVEVLEKLGDKQVTVPLRAILQEENDFETRKRIEMAINNLESGKSGEQIKEMFQPICTSCGEENTKNKPFCVSCGSKL